MKMDHLSENIFYDMSFWQIFAKIFIFTKVFAKICVRQKANFRIIFAKILKGIFGPTLVRALREHNRAAWQMTAQKHKRGVRIQECRLKALSHGFYNNLYGKQDLRNEDEMMTKRKYKMK
jgi:hypothetical protein